MQPFLAIPCLFAWLGLLAYRVGVSRSKNSVSAATRAMSGLIVAVLGFWAVGDALLSQNTSIIIALNYHCLIGWDMPPALLAFPLAFVTLAAGIAEAALIERGTFCAALVSSTVVASIVVPVAWSWAAHGWLHNLGFVDEAGASWVHLSAAAWGAVSAWMLGARAGKFNKDGSVNAIPGHNIPLASLGIGMMFIGQLFLVATATVSHDGGMQYGCAFLAAAGGGAAGMLITLWRYGKPDIMVVLVSFLGGAIAASAGSFSSPAAVAVGFVAGLLIPIAASVLDLGRIVDDPTGGITLHGVAGAWGTLAAAFLAAESAGHRLHALAIQILGVIAITGLSVVIAFLTFAVVRGLGRLRVRENDEMEGLDLADHDIAAYPDFQQNTIRSYHLREA